ncbi:MAG: SDR family NAD(P)-dependent oxidoreductase [Planctomycetota bacterium]
MQTSMAQWQIRDKHCVVTGASSGIGRELAKLLVCGGAKVVAVARRMDRLEKLRDELGTALMPVEGDVTKEECLESVRAALSGLGDQLDLLCNNAGIGAIGNFLDSDPRRLRQIMEVNFFAPANWIRGLIAPLRRSDDAVVCNVGSVLGHAAVPGKVEYCASKFALHGFTDAIRAELLAEGIQMTLVSPSTTESEFFDSLVDTDANAKSVSVGSWPADRVAAATLKAITHRRREAILSLGGKGLVYADRFCPPAVSWAHHRMVKSD